MNDGKMIYNPIDKVRKKSELILYSIQQIFAVLTATILIPKICGVPIAPSLVAAGIGTLIYLAITGFRSPMYISNSGATVSAVIGALSLGGAVEQNFTAVLIGGFVIAIVYCVAALLIKNIGTKWIDRFIPPVVIGPVVMVIGINLSKFIPTYMQVNGSDSMIGMAVGIMTMLVTAIIARYAKGFIKTIPILIALIVGYIACMILSVFGINIINLESMKYTSMFAVPDFAFFKIDLAGFEWSLVPNIIILFLPVSIAAIAEHISDHKALSLVIGKDLTKNPGLNKTLIGDGIASLFGCLIGGLPNTSYGESISTTAVSRVASSRVIRFAAIIMILSAFIAPITAFLESIPSCVFGGISIIAYGYIAFSGINALINSNIDYTNNKNVMIIASILTTGIGGMSINIGTYSLSGVALALVVGVVMNVILNKGDY